MLPLLPSYPHFLFSSPTAPPPSFSLLVLSLGETKSILWRPSWVPLQSGPLTDSEFAFLCSNNFLCFHFLFLSAFVLIETQSLISPVWRSFPSWTCWEAQRVIQGSCHTQFQSAPQVPVHWKFILIHTQGMRINELTQHWSQLSYVSVDTWEKKEIFWHHLRR